MAEDEDGERSMNTSDLGPSENMTVGPVQVDGVRISDLHLSEDGTLNNTMQTDGGIFFADNHEHSSDESSEHFGETTAYLSGNTTEAQAVDDHDHHRNLSMAEHQNHHMTNHSHANLSMGMMMMEHEHDEYDHAHGGRQLMMEIGILTSLVMLILALVILSVIPSNRFSILTFPV